MEERACAASRPCRGLAARASPVPLGTLSPKQARTELVRRTLAAQGLAECVTFSFMAQAEAALFGDTPEALRLTNPIAADLDQLRPTPIATLALAAQRNAARGYPDVALFEIGPEFALAAMENQRWIAAGLRAGATPRNWLAPQRPVDAMDAKADLWAAMSAIGVPLDALMLTQDAPGFYHPGRSATVRQGPKTLLGSFGELPPRVLAARDLAGPAVAVQLDLDAISEPKRRRKAAPDLPPFQAVRRDFAFLVDSEVTADAVLRAARGADRTLITSASLFDVYQGDRLPAGKKSLAIEVTFQPRERTLTDAEIETVSQKVVAAVTKATGATCADRQRTVAPSIGVSRREPCRSRHPADRLASACARSDISSVRPLSWRPSCHPHRAARRSRSSPSGSSRCAAAPGSDSPAWPAVAAAQVLRRVHAQAAAVEGRSDRTRNRQVQRSRDSRRQNQACVRSWDSSGAT
jgi:hypothetical protein